MKKTLTGLLTAVLLISSVYAGCIDDYSEKIGILSNKRIIFKPQNGSTLIGSIGQTLGATAIGITAGGVAGFVLPYAITGLTYGGMTVAGVIATAGTTAAGLGTGIAIDNALDDEGFVLSFLMGTGAVATDLLAIKGFRAWGPLMKSAANVSSTLIPLTTHYFVPISAVIGGVAGLTVGARDAILNYKIRQLVKAKRLIESAQNYVELGNLSFKSEYKKLSKNIRKKHTLKQVASKIAELDNTDQLCNDSKPLNYNKLKQLLKAEYNFSDIASTYGISNKATVEDFTALANEVKSLNLLENNRNKPNDIVYFESI